MPEAGIDSVKVNQQLAALAALCDLEQLDPVGDWTVDRWVMSAEAIDRLVETYSDLLIPVDTELDDLLQEDGVDLTTLLLDEDHTADPITRSDMTELAATASAVRSHGLDLNASVLPNIPKGSRSQSGFGVDVLTTSVSPGPISSPLKDDEWLLICSVKHTVADGSDMRHKLDISLGLPLPYLTAQVRVLHGRMAERGDRLDRVFLTLADFPNGPHIRVIGAGCADKDHADQFLKSLGHFSGAPFDHGHVRCIEIAGMQELHERINV
jgi:hypothetical protein